jgi:succinate dehydrogenase / fumarate reductase flavoprotein subunit
LVDIFVFGHRAGRHAAENARHIQLGMLSLEHVMTYNATLEKHGIASENRSPMLLPDYRFENALTKVQHTKTHQEDR